MGLMKEFWEFLKIRKKILAFTDCAYSGFVWSTDCVY